MIKTRRSHKTRINLLCCAYLSYYYHSWWWGQQEIGKQAAQKRRCLRLVLPTSALNLIPIYQTAHTPGLLELKLCFQIFLSCMWNEGGSLKGRDPGITVPLFVTKTPFQAHSPGPIWREVQDKDHTDVSSHFWLSFTIDNSGMYVLFCWNVAMKVHYRHLNCIFASDIPTWTWYLTAECGKFSSVSGEILFYSNQSRIVLLTGCHRLSPMVFVQTDKSLRRFACSVNVT